MTPGDRVADRWEVVADAPGEREIGRWRAVDLRTGEPVEILALRTPAAHAPDELRRFARVHRDLLRARAPGLVATHEVVDHGGREVAVREPLDDPTLADVRGPLPAGVVAAIGARLLPAVLAAGPATLSALRPEDVGLDAQGRPVLAPRGHPAGRVGPRDRVWVAPEAFDGAASDGAAGLYGLGVLLHRLATGHTPLATEGAPPPPSRLRPGIPPALDAAILRLLSRDPAARATALASLEGEATTAVDLRTFARPRVDDEIRYTTHAEDPGARPRDASVDRRAGIAVLLPARELAALDPAGRSAAAGFAEVPLATVERLAEQGQPLVLGTHARREDARRRVQELDANGLPATLVEGSGFLAPLLALAGAATATIAGLVLLLVLLAGWTAPLAVVPILVVVVASAVVAAGAAWSWRSRSGALQAARTAHSARQRARRTGDDPLARAWSRIAALRRQLALADLPSAAAADLRRGLKEVEAHLEALEQAARLAEEALSQADADHLRARVASLSRQVERRPELADQRDRLARTLTDLEAVERQRRHVQTEAARVEEALDEVATTLAQQPAGGDPALDDAAVERLVRSTRLVRESVEQLDEETRQRPPRLGEEP